MSYMGLFFIFIFLVLLITPVRHAQRRRFCRLLDIGFESDDRQSEISRDMVEEEIVKFVLGKGLENLD